METTTFNIDFNWNIIYNQNKFKESGDNMEVYIVVAEQLYSLKDNETALRKHIEENLNLEVFDENTIKEVIDLLKINKSKDFVIGQVAGFLAMK